MRPITAFKRFILVQKVDKNSRNSSHIRLQLAKWERTTYKKVGTTLRERERARGVRVKEHTDPGERVTVTTEISAYLLGKLYACIWVQWIESAKQMKIENIYLLQNKKILFHCTLWICADLWFFSLLFAQSVSLSSHKHTHTHNATQSATTHDCDGTHVVTER